jgi:glycosyltransferase involved in cell wall biosynthesis
MKRVTIFTTFFDASPAYSLNQCVQDQIRMLISGGYKPTIIVVEGFKPVEMYAHPDVTLAHIPHFPVNNGGELPDNYQELVAKTRDALIAILKDTDVCITHDVIYQPAHLIHNLAAREVGAKLPGLRWLHWIHSATSPEILCSVESVRPLIKRPFPNSFVCYPNYFDIPRVAENYGYEEDQIKWVPHPIDICDYLGFHEMTARLVKERKLLGADLIVVYPARLDRGKQPEHIIKILGAIKATGRSVKLVLMDFHSTAGDKVAYREELRETARKWDVEKDVIFLSEFDYRLRYDAPRQMVRDLMLISSVFIHPSVSETYGLVVQEAAICKNQLVLNRDFPPMMTLWGPHALYKQFSSAINSNTGKNGDTMWTWSDGRRMPYPENEDLYYKELASNILYYVENNPVLMEQKMVRQERSIEYVMNRFLIPLLNR